MKNKVIKILFINIISIFFVFIIFDFCYMYKNVEFMRQFYPVVEKAFENPKNIVKYYFQRYVVYFKRFSNFNKILEDAYVFDVERRYRPVENPNSDKKSIIIFGCSYAYGDNLEDNETFSYQLGRITGQPVYNRAFSGRSPQYMLYQVLNPHFYDYIKTEPEFIIYVYYYDQLIRLFAPCHYFNSGGVYSEPVMFMRKRGDEYMPDRFPSITSASPLIIKMKREFYQRLLYLPSNYFKSADILYDYFETARNAIRKKYPNTKFVIVSYVPDIFMEIAERKLKKDGFYFFHVDRTLIKTREFCFLDEHPSPHAWEYYTPKIVDFLDEIRNEEK